MKLYQTLPYMREIKAGETIATRKERVIFSHVTDNGSIAYYTEADRLKFPVVTPTRIMSPSNFLNVMVRE